MSPHTGRRHALRWAAACALPTAIWPHALRAQATTIYRCGPDGRTLSDAPCADGRRQVVQPPPPLGDPGEAQDLARRDQRLAAQLQAQRQARERAAVAGPGGVVHMPPEEPVSVLKPAKKRRRRTRAEELTDEGLLTPPLKADGASR